MKVSTVVVGEGDYSPLDDAMFRMSMRSAALAGAEPARVPSADAARRVVDAALEYGHLMERGTVVLPEFYRAMTNACDYAGTDYAYCKAAMLGEKPTTVETPVPGRMSLGQVLVRTWVLVELGVGREPKELLERVLREYRGTEVPHVLVAEAGP